jgi:hydrogenase maturation protease
MNPTTRILCLGNELASDDGVGMRLGRILTALPLPDGVSVRFHPQVDLDLIDDLRGAARLILCDATRTGAAPGTVTMRSWQEVAAYSRQPYCCHGIGLSDLVKLAAALEPDPSQFDIQLVGVEAETLDVFGTRLSDAVQAALPLAVARVLELVSADARVITLGQAAAREIAEPGRLEAFGG